MDITVGVRRRVAKRHGKWRGCFVVGLRSEMCKQKVANRMSADNCARKRWRKNSSNGVGIEVGVRRGMRKQNELKWRVYNCHCSKVVLKKCVRRGVAKRCGRWRVCIAVGVCRGEGKERVENRVGIKVSIRLGVAKRCGRMVSVYSSSCS